MELPTTLLDVRYYDQVFHPHFFVGKGVSGWFIRVLNWLRYKLETYVQYRILLLGISESSIIKKEDGSTEEVPLNKKEMKEGFWRDVLKERLTSELASPLLLQSSISGSPSPSQVSSRESRYQQARVSRVIQEVEEDVPDRPLPIDDLAQRYGGEGRAAKYGRGPLVYEDEFEPVVINTAEPEKKE